MVAKITINGIEFTGVSEVSVVNNRIIVDGVEKPWPDGIVTQRVQVVVVEGALKSVRSDASIECGNVSGNVNAGGSVQCENVNGAVSAGGSVQAKGKLSGNISAGGSVRISN